MDTIFIKRYYVTNTIIEMKHDYNKSVNLHHCFYIVTTANCEAPDLQLSKAYKYLLPFQWVLVLAPTHLLLHGGHSLPRRRSS